MNGLEPLDLTASLEVTGPAIAIDEIGRLVRDHYGLEGEITKLGSERDANFLLRGDGIGAVAKISNAAESAEVTALQTAMLLHLERVAPALPVPKLVRTLDGRVDCQWRSPEGSTHLVRLLSLLPGAPSFAVFDVAALERLAAVIAELDLALASFQTHHASHDLLWNVARADRVETLVPHIEDAEDRALAAAAIGQWRAQVAPDLSAMRWQVIHNDLNRHNLLFDDTGALTGIIDFGDSVRAPLVAELATSAAYFPDPSTLAEDALTMARAYHRRLPLQEIELRHLFGLIAARHALTLAITAWRAKQHPHNRDYILRNAPRASSSLRALAQAPADLANALLDSCLADSET